ncbi:MAG: LacI family DNA-binding transcriptional regulator [Holdemanella sp.]|nr:LacI family DNA-binding transcriptional regulator [Holdemanella sp.]
MDNKAISIKDIAAMSGVSIATVSRILNNKGGYSKKTEEKIKQICEENGFIINQAAKSLKEQKSNIVGMIVPNINNLFYANMTFEVESILEEKGISLLICNTGNDSEKEKSYFKTLISKNVDGIICISGLSKIDNTVIPRNIPTVLLDRYPVNTLDLPVVMNDEIETATRMTNSLIDMGCKHILYLTGYSNKYEKNERLTGYEIALEQNHIPVDKRYELRRQGKQPSHIEYEVLVYDFLKLGLAVDGVLAGSERSALGALEAFRRMGISVPDDIKLISYDNTLCSILTTPTLSSVERNYKTSARTVCDLLLDIINGDKHMEGQKIIVPTYLIERKSTK